MRINTDKSIKLGERIYDKFGSWDAVRKAADVKDGAYVVRPDGPHREKKAAPAT